MEFQHSPQVNEEVATSDFQQNGFPSGMKRRMANGLAWLLGAALAVVVTGCASQQAAVRSPKAQLVQDAEKYVSELKAQDKLPGYSSAENGKLIALAPFDRGHVSYPASVTVRAWKQGDDSMYCYTLEKHTKDSPWRLVRAIRLDNHGKVTEQFYPK